jgi:site-specific recombinase XerD
MPRKTSPTQVFDGYAEWLDRQPLSANTRRTYGTQVRQFCRYLVNYPPRYSDPLVDEHARDYTVRDYKTFLKVQKKRRPSTINLALAAIDHFYRFLQLGAADVKREDLPQQAPQALSPEEQKDFLRAVERCGSTRDQAIALLLFYTGLRVGECAALDVDDVLVSARKGKVIVRSGKGDTYREVPLNAAARQAQQNWKQRRRQRMETEGIGTSAYFINRYGERLSTRSIDVVARRLAKEAGIKLSAHTLRHTCLTNLVRAGHDIVLVAEIAGHRRLETTRRYSLPSEQDRAAAMEAIHIDY